MVKSRHNIVGLISIIAILLSQFSASPVQAFAATEISSAAQLNNIRNAGLSGNYVLVNDIDLNEIGVWTPLGTSSTSFTGTLDGAGYTIFNLVISNTQTSDQGLFGVIDTGASVSNLQIKNANITAADNAGILAGTNKGTISKVFAQGVITGATSVGGLVGTNSGSIINSYAMATVSGKDKAGGLVGSNDSTGTLTNTYAVSTVSGAVTNNYLVFDGIDDYISIPHNATYDINDYTLEAWFQWTPIKENESDTNEWDNVSFIVGKGLENFEIHTGGGSGTYGIRFIPINRDKEAGGNIAAYNDVHNVLQPGWNHVATTWHLANGYGEVRVYLNGILQDIYQNTVENKGTVATVPLTVSDPFSDNTEELFIGARNDQNYGLPCMFFRGNISDVRFWNRVRTPEEISADKYKQLTGNESGLIGYWKLDNLGEGGYIEDSSIVGNDGTLYGAPAWVHDSGTNGGLVGENTNTSPSAITSSFYDTTVSKLTDSDRGTPLTTTAMKTQSSFSGWSFPTVWKMIDGSTYPSLFTINVTLNQAAGQSDPSNASSINFTAVFDEPINTSSFTAEDVTLSGTAGATSVAISQIAPNDGTTFNIAVSGMTSDGTVIAAIAENKVLDVANNLNTASTTTDNSVTYDATAPTVTISSTAANPTKTSPIPVTITFSEDMTGFELGDITVGNGTAGNLLGSGKTYTADITPSADGEVTVDIAADAAIDSSSNGNTAATQFTISYDATAPTVTISSTAANPTKTSPIPVTITFSEDVTGFGLGDITIGNGTASNLLVSGKTYTADITPSSNGEVTVDIAADVAVDASKNGNTAATQFKITYDATAPTVAITSAASSPTKTSPIPVTITFSEDVTGFELGDITVGNGTAGNLLGSGKTYTADITPSSNGEVTVDIAADVAVDASKNGNTAATQFKITYDATAPTVAITSAASSPTKTSPIPVTITFSEDVTGFELGDITVGNGTAGNLLGSGKTYTADITPSSNGEVKVDIAADAAVDAASNGNTVATQFKITYDSISPTVTISSTAANPTKTSPIPVTITFSEDVTGFELGDIVVGNGTAGNLLGSEKTYTADITPSADGEVRVDIAANVAVDSSSNGNTAAAEFKITYDATAPTVTISSTAANPTKTSPIPITITFSEDVTGVELGDITVGNGTAGNLLGSGKNYTADIMPTADGEVTVDFAENVVADAAYNGNTAAAQFKITYDATAPTVTISSTAANPTKTSPIPVTITFSENVTGFELGDITVGNGTAGNLLGSGKTYTADITPSADGEVTVDIAANVVIDAASNGNTAAAQFKISYDATRPGLTINQAVGQIDPTGASPINFTVEFEEPIDVSSFTGADVNLSGTAGATTKVISQIAPDDGTTFNIEVSGMTGNGTIIATIAEDKVLDTAGNTNSASTSTDNVITYEISGPVITVSTLNTKYTSKGPATFTVTFNEEVYDPQEDTDPEDVTNPANYLLVERGVNRIFDTVSCAEGVTPDDTQIAIDMVTYNHDTLTSTITLIEPLPIGKYRLFICGTTSIVDVARNPLNGGTDAIYNITVLPASDDDDVTIDSSTILPNSGFAPGKITPLAKQPIEKAYANTDLILEIPSLGVKTSIVGIPQVDNEWDVSWLGKNAGYLYGSAYPTWEGNTVLTGHVWNADNTPGIFANLKTLKYGDQFYIHAYGKVYTYEVRENRQVNARKATTVFKSEELDWVTLLTCEGYNPKGDTYTSRRMVRAVLIDVK
jgi:LPXTG-site transpeptidase (sortase) family protein